MNRRGGGKTTQDKGAPIENPVAEISKFLANTPKLLADEIARLREENEALRIEVDAAQTAYHEARGIIVSLLRYATWESHGKEGVVLAAHDPESKEAFDFLGWPNPCPKDQAT